MIYYSGYNYAGSYQMIYGTSGLKDERGFDVDLGIYQKKPLPVGKSFKLLGGIKSLKFSYEGDQGDITAPIVKCSLSLSLGDCPEKSTSSRHYGPWDEFYTSDATKYIIRVSVSKNYTIFRWEGYLTPDSYSEDIDSCGAVTLTARDNLGHLEDFPFDMEGNNLGLARIDDIINTALAKVQFLQICNDTYNGSKLRMYESNMGTHEMSALWVSVTAFKDKNWYQALESILSSIGMRMCFREQHYDVWNLRSMPIFGTNSGTVPTTAIKFLHGTRSYTPAWRMIEETIDFAADKTVSITPKAVVSASTTKYEVGYWNGSSTVYNNGRCSVLDSQTPVRGFVGSTRGYLDQSRYSYIGNEGSDFFKGVFLVANVSSRSTPIFQRFSLPVTRGDFKAVFKFASQPAVYRRGEAMNTLDAGLEEIKYAIIAKDSSDTIYYWDSENAQWTTSESEITASFERTEYPTDLEITVPSLTGATTTLLNIVYIELRRITYKATSRRGGYLPGSGSGAVAPPGIYARLRSIEITDEDVIIPGTSKTTTINNNSYNLINQRTPEFGMNTAVSSYQREGSTANFAKYVIPDICENCFYTEDGKIAVNQTVWSITGVVGQEEILALSAQIAKQLLMYHHRTFELLEGECVPENNSAGIMNYYPKYTYKGKSYLLQSATYNIITGRFENCMLREVSTWDDLYGDAVLTVVPSVIDLSEDRILTLSINSNTEWNVTNKPAELTVSHMSGTGPKDIIVSRLSSTTQISGNLVIATTDGTVTITLPVIATATFALLYTGPGSAENLAAGRDHYYQISIYYPAGQTCTIDKPSWLHFYSSDLENGTVPNSGVYDFYVDALPSGTTTRGDFVDIYCGEDERELAVRQNA